MLQYFSIFLSLHSQVYINHDILSFIVLRPDRTYHETEIFARDEFDSSQFRSIPSRVEKTSVRQIQLETAPTLKKSSSCIFDFDFITAQFYIPQSNKGEMLTKENLFVSQMGPFCKFKLQCIKMSIRDPIVTLFLY